MYEKKVLEKWLKQIQSGELNPDALGLGKDREKAIKKIRDELNAIAHNKPLITIKQK